LPSFGRCTFARSLFESMSSICCPRLDPSGSQLILQDLTHFHRLKVVRGDGHDLLRNLVKRGDPERSDVVHNVHLQDIPEPISSDQSQRDSPVDRLWEPLIALLTKPRTPFVDYFLVTPIQIRTCRVVERFLLDETDCCLCSEVICLFAHSKLLIFCLCNGLQFTGSGTFLVRSGGGGVRVSLELFIASFCVIPFQMISSI